MRATGSSWKVRALSRESRTTLALCWATGCDFFLHPDEQQDLRGIEWFVYMPGSTLLLGNGVTKSSRIQSDGSHGRKAYNVQVGATRGSLRKECSP